MEYSKVIFNNQTLIDLTSDTVSASDLRQGVTAHGANGELITGSNDKDSNTTDATATANEILQSKTAYVNKQKIMGTMPNNGAVNGKISSKSESYTISEGYHNGNGTVAIDSAEQAKIIPDNIKRGVTVLGVQGTHEGGIDTSDATAVQAEILDSKTVYVNGQKITGAMPNNGAVSGEIATVSGAYIIPEGYHNGNGTVVIATAEQAKIIPENIKNGIVILGVIGNYEGEPVVITPSSQIKFITPYTTSQSIEPDEGYDYFSRIIVEPIMYVETENSKGTTVTIGEGEGSVRVYIADLANDTVTSEKLLQGYTAHDANGEQITGTFTYPDLTQDTVRPDKLLRGYTAHNANGEAIEGTNTYNADTRDATAYPSDILSGQTAYAKGEKITGTIPKYESYDPLHEFTTKDEYFTVPRGYYDGYYGVVEIKYEEQQKIIPENIKSGINILGVTGSYTGNGSGIDTSDATANASEILINKTAYINGQKVTGLMPNNAAVSGIISSLDNNYSIPEGYHNGNGIVVIDSAEKAKILPENIKSGVSILGVTGTHEGGSGSGVDLSNDTVRADRLRIGHTAHDANGQLITGTLATAALEPLEYDYNCGYVANGVWIYENPTATYIDIYEVIEGHEYYFTLGVTVGSRNRVMFTTTDIRTITSGRITGTQIVNKNDPSARENFYYTPSSNGYILAAKDNVGYSGLKTYLYDLTVAWV